MDSMTRTHWLLVTIVGVQLWIGGGLLESVGPTLIGFFVGLFGALGTVLSLFEKTDPATRTEPPKVERRRPRRR